TFPSFRPQPRGTPHHRFLPPRQRDALLPGFTTLVQARRRTPPNQVRHPTDRQFASGCSPPRLAATQLPSATELWPTPAGTSTLQIARPRGRTLNRSRGSRLQASAAISCAAGSAMLLSEAIRLVHRQEQNHEPIDSRRLPTSSAHDRGHAPTQARRQDADRLCPRRTTLGRLPAPLA